MKDPPQGYFHIEINSEYLRPWKLSTLGIGLTLLVIGSYYYDAPDWDVLISFIMGISAYIFAPWSLRVILDRDWTNVPEALFVSWFTIDGCYSIYWYLVDPIAWVYMRDANLPASFGLYLVCAVLWLPNKSLSELLK